MIVYVDQIKFQSKELAEIGKPSKKISEAKNQNFIPLGKTYFKVLRGASTANKLLFCCFSFCMQQFFETGDLKTHMRTHTNDRPFHCDF